MNNLNNIIKASNTVRNLKRYADMKDAVKKSKLPDDFKRKALEECEKMEKLMLLYGMELFCFLIAGGVWISMLIKLPDTDMADVFIRIVIIITVSIASIVWFYRKQKKITPAYREACRLVRLGLDGLSGAEKEKNQADGREQKLVKKIRKTGYFWAVVWIMLMFVSLCVLSEVKIVRFEEGVSVFIMMVILVFSIPYVVKIKRCDTVAEYYESGGRKTHGSIDCDPDSPGKWTGITLYTTAIVILMIFIGNTCDFRTEEERMWDTTWERYHEATDNMDEAKDKMDRINQKLEEMGYND